MIVTAAPTAGGGGGGGDFLSSYIWSRAHATINDARFESVVPAARSDNKVK